jgi:hypothetical protein
VTLRREKKIKKATGFRIGRQLLKWQFQGEDKIQMQECAVQYICTRVSRYWNQNACDPGIDTFWYKTTKKHS